MSAIDTAPEFKFHCRVPRRTSRSGWTVAPTAEVRRAGKTVSIADVIAAASEAGDNDRRAFENLLSLPANAADSAELWCHADTEGPAVFFLDVRDGASGIVGCQGITRERLAFSLTKDFASRARRFSVGEIVGKDGETLPCESGLMGCPGLVIPTTTAARLDEASPLFITTGVFETLLYAWLGFAVIGRANGSVKSEREVTAWLKANGLNRTGSRSGKPTASFDFGAADFMAQRFAGKHIPETESAAATASAEVALTGKALSRNPSLPRLPRGGRSYHLGEATSDSAANLSTLSNRTAKRPVCIVAYTDPSNVDQIVAELMSAKPDDAAKPDTASASAGFSPDGSTFAGKKICGNVRGPFPTSEPDVFRFYGVDNPRPGMLLITEDPEGGSTIYQCSG